MIPLRHKLIFIVDKVSFKTQELTKAQNGLAIIT